MFDSREACLEHRDTVVQVLQDRFGEQVPWHTHPTLDAAVVRIPTEHLDAATDAFESEGLKVDVMGESGDWKELKVKPESYT